MNREILGFYVFLVLVLAFTNFKIVIFNINIIIIINIKLVNFVNVRILNL